MNVEGILLAVMRRCVRRYIDHRQLCSATAGMLTTEERATLQSGLSRLSSGWVNRSLGD